MSEKKLIALTFDDGPNTTTTGEVLDLLEQYQIRASFFLIGNLITDETIPMIKREMSLGCEIQNHSWTHSFMDQMDAETIHKEIDDTSKKIEEVTGKKPQFFRPPFIAVNALMYQNIDMPFICGIGVEDWVPTVSSEERAKRLMAEAKDGALFLLHDLKGNVNTVEALKTVIPELLRQGYTFVTVSELFKAKNVSIEKHPGKIYSLIEDPATEKQPFYNKIKIDINCPDEVYKIRENAQYGTLEHVTYHSESIGCDRGFNILLPVGYTKEKQYPVLYFLHGIFGDEYTMPNDENCHLKEIAGNMMADGTCEEMIIVFPSMYATKDPDMKPSFDPASVLPYNDFIFDLVNDLNPYIEANYSTKKGRKYRAISGFSMGGRETLFIGLSRPDIFGYIGAVAPAPGLTPGKDWAMTHPGQMKEADAHFAPDAPLPYVFLVCCGTDDKTVGKFPESYHIIFTANQVGHNWYEIPGADHDFKAISSMFHNYLAAIFHE